jgi:hypothetical protein
MLRGMRLAIVVFVVAILSTSAVAERVSDELTTNEEIETAIRAGTSTKSKKPWTLEVSRLTDLPRKPPTEPFALGLFQFVITTVKPDVANALATALGDRATAWGSVDRPCTDRKIGLRLSRGTTELRLVYWCGRIYTAPDRYAIPSKSLHVAIGKATGAAKL